MVNTPFRHRGNQRYLAFGLSLIVIVLGTVAALTWLRLLDDSAATELAVAQSHWSSRSFHRYNAIINISQNGVWCTQDILMQDDMMLDVRVNNCPDPPMTINGLFSTIQQRMHTPSCDFVQCRCPIYYSTRVRYDTELGYPASIEFGAAAAPASPEIPDYWMLGLQQVQPSPCAVIGAMDSQQITVSLVISPSSAEQH